MATDILLEIGKCMLFLFLHFGVLAGAVILLEKKVGLPSEVYRKLLHLVSVFSIMPIVIPASNWIASSQVCVLFIIIAYLGSTHSNLEKDVNMTQRKPGEQLKSMVLLYSTYAFVITFVWGVFGQKWGAVLSVIAWGIGDAVAALVGKRFGKHKLRGKWIEGTKSVEGSVGMFIATFFAVFFLYQRHTSFTNIWFVVLVCFWIAIFSTFAELFSKNGLDTVLCPTVSMIGFIILTLVNGGI
ncbi:MAG: hypothetical protein K6F00_09420 [Lachnospiraceae bacterium]|nr:hypothetical protein [Lachnospiraceae bacterium]